MTNQRKINLEPIRNLRHSQKNILFQSTENKSKKYIFLRVLLDFLPSSLKIKNYKNILKFPTTS